MSHFSVLVITQNGTEEEISTQLAPFHEFECTGVDDEFVVDVDVTSDQIESWKKYNSGESFLKHLEDEGFKAVPYGQDLNKGHDHKYGYALLNQSGEVEKVINRTNPNKTWDWWVIGGRWSGFLFGDLNSTLVSELNCGHMDLLEVEKERSRAAKIAIEYKMTPEELRDLHRKAANWHAQYVHSHGWKGALAFDVDGSAEKAEKTIWNFLVGLPVETRGNPDLDKWIESRKWSTYALVHEKQWHASGTMGWWGMSHGDKPDWDEQFRKILDGIPGNYHATVVDCHI